MPYHSAKRVWDHLLEVTEEQHLSNARALLLTWWSHTYEYPNYPFQFCSTTGKPQFAKNQTCSCITMVKDNNGRAEFPEWTDAIREDELIPNDVRLLEDCLPDDFDTFSNYYNRLIEWQEAMRKGKMPCP